MSSIYTIQKTRCLLLVFMILSMPVGNAQRSVPDGYKTILSDDFDDTLNAAWWSKGLWGAQNAHLFPNYNKGGGRHRINDFFAGYVVDSNTMLKDGHLELHNVKETMQGTDPEGRFNYTNAMVNTLGKVKINGSRKSIIIRTRAKFPHARDVWPSIWLVAQYDWPPEIDVWEYFGQNFDWGTRNFMKLSWIYGEKFNKQGEVSWRCWDFHEQFDVTKFHTYEFEWTDQVMITRIEGVEYSRFTRGGQRQLWGTG